MTHSFKSKTLLLFVFLFTVFTLNAQKSSCDPKDKQDCTEQSEVKTSGCAPSSCRGEQTKFGEAKVISELRQGLVAVKAKMEKSTKPKFSARSYDIHNIVGESDNESLDIIIRELKIIEAELSSKGILASAALDLPENSAKKVKYLKDRIAILDKHVN